MRTAGWAATQREDGTRVLAVAFFAGLVALGATRWRSMLLRAPKAAPALVPLPTLVAVERRPRPILPVTTAVRVRRSRRPKVTAGRITFALSFGLFLAFGLSLNLHYDLINGDALSRVANAYYVVYSRDPHVAAVGFIWNPLPSLVEIPLLPLRAIWPAITQRGVAGVFMSALFMAGAVAEVHGILRDRELPRSIVLIFTALFAVQPMILLYGANGMSEAPMVFFLLLATRHLLRWMDARRTSALVVAGIALGFSYWARYEGFAAGSAAIALVLGVSYTRTRGPRAARLRDAATDAALVGLPFVFSVVAWSAASLIIVRDPFPVLNSQYGNSALGVSGAVGASSQVKVFSSSIVSAVGGHSIGDRAGYMARQLLLLQPLTIAMVLVVVVLALAVRNARVLVPVAVLGSVLLLEVALFLEGKTFGWLRFSVLEIPLAMVCAGLAMADVRRPRLARGRLGIATATGAFAVALAVAVPTSLVAMHDRRLGREESPVLDVLPVIGARGSSVNPIGSRRFAPARDIAVQLDQMHLRSSSVLADSAFAFPIVLASAHPHQFVITSDRDFKPALSDPALYKVRYLLVPSPSVASYDALNVEYPKLYDDGGGVGRLVRSFTYGNDPNRWRLYVVTSHPGDEPPNQRGQG